MTTLIAFLFVIGVIVLVHEFGHFVMARRCGVHVEVFSLGFGPKLLTLRRHGTVYCISAIPLGGYVKMAGEGAGAPAAPGTFMSTSKWQRCQILAAGPAMNLILAAVIVAVIALWGIDAESFGDASPVVGAVVPGSPADRAGIRAGDHVLSVAEQAAPTWDAFETAIGTRPGGNVPLTLRRGAQTVMVEVTPEPEPPLGVGRIGVRRHVESVVASIAPGGAADRAGLRSGDVIIAAHDAPTDVSAGPLLPSAARPVDLTVRRDGSEQTVTLVPANSDPDMGYSAVASTTIRGVGPIQAARLGVEWTADTAALLLRTIGEMVSGSISPSQLMGPIGVAQLTGEAMHISWSALFSIMAFLSVNIGVFNLLPIPVLDGGHIMTLAIEAITRRDLTAGTRRAIAHAGLAALLILTVVVFYNDLSRLGWMPG